MSIYNTIAHIINCNYHYLIRNPCLAETQGSQELIPKHTVKSKTWEIGWVEKIGLTTTACETQPRIFCKIIFYKAVFWDWRWLFKSCSEWCCLLVCRESAALDSVPCTVRDLMCDYEKLHLFLCSNIPNCKNEHNSICLIYLPF